MNKYVKSENGNTLMIVLGFVIVLSLVIAPLALRTSNGLLQAKSGGLKESAYSDAHSAMTLFAKLYEEARRETKEIFGGLASEADWIVLLDGEITNTVLARYPNVQIRREGDGVESEWIFKAKDGPAVVNYNDSGSYYRSGEVVYSLKNGIGGGIIDPLPTMPPGSEDGEEKPEIPAGAKIMLRAIDSLGLPKYNKMFALCTINASETQVNVLSHDWIGEWKIDANGVWTLDDSSYFDNYFTNEEFDSEYGRFLDYYTDIEGRVDAFPFYSGAMNGSDDPRLNDAKNVATNRSESQLTVVNGSPVWTAGRNGNVEIKGRNNSSFSFQNPVYVGGNLTFTQESNQDMKIGVSISAPEHRIGLAVGGDFWFEGRQNNSPSFTIDHSVYIKGNFTAKGISNWTFVINGDLVIGGDFRLETDSLKNFKVSGDIIVGGKAEIVNNSSTNGTIDIGGSLQAQSNVVFPHLMPIHVGGDVLSGGSFTIGMINSLIQIDGNLATAGDIVMTGSNSGHSFTVGGHMLSKSNIRLAESSQINGPVSVGGTVAASANVNVGNTLNSSGTIKVKENIIAGLDFNFTLNGNVDGMLRMESANLLVFRDANFSHINGTAYQKIILNMISVKRYVKFGDNNYTHVNNSFIHNTPTNYSHNGAVCLTDPALG